MGNTEYLNNGTCDMHIETEFPFYNSGSVVRGVVYLNSREQLFKQSLYIRIEGKEKCLWYEGSSFNKRRYEGLHDFYHIDFVLARFQLPIEPGSYAWPFTIYLSENLPGSFESILNPEIFIKYRLGCYLIDYDEPRRSNYHWRPLTIRQPFRLGLSPLEGQMLSNPTLCCSPSGPTQIHAVLSKNVCFIGQGISIRVDINNIESSNLIKGVNVALVQNIFVASNSGAVRTFKKPLHVLQADGCPPRGSNSYQIALSVPVGVILDSTSVGTIVANYYTVELTAISSGCSTSGEPYVNAPLYVIAQEPLLPKYMQPYEPFPNTMYNPMQMFRPPPFFFKQNRKLPIMNFIHMD